MSKAFKPGISPADGSKADFISRWSRLKHQAVEQAGSAASAYSAREHEKSPDDQAPENKVLTDADMPAIETLTPESVYSDFLSPGVSDRLRKLALRKLFHSEVFNIRDGLDEYDGDYTQFEKLGSIVTSDMRHQMELEAERQAQQLLADQDQACTDASIDDAEPDHAIARAEDHGENTESEIIDNRVRQQESRQGIAENTNRDLAVKAIDLSVSGRRMDRKRTTEDSDVEGDDDVDLHS